ncbi:MAG: metallophosphoesterase family protein [Candidatus Bathyarchaeia archaeon]
MRVRGCDRDCGSCPIEEICGGVEQYGVKGYRCPYAGCELKAPALKAMQECDVCRLGKVAWDLDEVEAVELLSEVMGLERTEDNQRLDLPDVVPAIPLRFAPSLRIGSLGVGAVIVSYQDLLDNNAQLEVLEKGGIHSYLGFGGKILLSSVMPDELLLRQDVFEGFVRLFDAAGFDAANSWVNLLMGLKLTHAMITRGIPVVGLLKGNVEKQIAFSAEVLSRMGIRAMGLHASEYMSAFKEDAVVRQILYAHFRCASKLASSLLLLGSLSYRWLDFIHISMPKNLKLSLAGMGWLIDAERGLLYSGNGCIDAHSKFVECGCSTCSGASPKELVADPSARARHNLNNLMDRIRGNSPPELHTYDLALEEDESALLVSDLHLWTGRSLLNGFLELLREELPTNLLFLGDTFDLEKGRPNVPETTALFDTLRELGPAVFVVKGCSDGDQVALLRALDRIAMEGHARPFLWTEVEEESLRNVVLDLYRLYRCASDRLEVRLADGSVLLAVHGNDIVEDRDSTIETAMEAMKEAKVKANVRWLVMGHLHRLFIDRENGIASTGCWVFGDTVGGERTRKTDLKSAIVVHGDGELELIRGC